MLTYCTGIWTHHQAEVCKELHKILGSEFKMVLTLPLDAPVSKERIAMGWDLTPPDEDWIVGPPKTVAEARQVDYSKYIIDPDVAVLGWIPEVPDCLVMRRIRSGKLTFFQSERLFKQKPTLKDWVNPFYLKWRLSLWRKLHPKNVHFLTLSHWCAEDLESLGVCRGRTWKWGYLTKVSAEMPHKERHDKLEIGWCGRYLPLKHVDTIISAVSKLSQAAMARCHLTLVGDGGCRDEIEQLVGRLGIDGVVSFKGRVSAAGAVEFMRGLDLYVFASNREDGWGAVLGEAMDAGCAIASSIDAGATLELVKDGVNGYVFECGDDKALAGIMENMILNPDRCREMGEEAWRTLQEWSPEVGARSLVSLINALQSGDVSRIPEKGLCSRVR